MAQEVRERLLDAALRLLDSEGPEALQARRLAAEVGASTMAVYTHFGGMRELLEALVRDGFLQLDQRLEQVPRTEDPAADLFRVGLAYREHALARPQLYRLMFGLAKAGSVRGNQDITTTFTPTSEPEGKLAFEYLTTAVSRLMDTGRIHRGEPWQVAGQLWSALHGYVLLEIAGFFGDGHGVDYVLGPLAQNLVIGLGDSPERVRRSIELARS